MGGSVLYLDTWSGISGDMLLAALLDADRESGRLEKVLRTVVDALGLEGTNIDVKRATLHGVECTRVTVDDGDAAPLRHLQEMEQVITGAALSFEVRDRATRAVRRLAEVEAGIHGCSVNEIHFHEIGAVDTLVDVVGAFSLVEALGIEQVFVGTIPVGGGTVQIEHGVVGVPAPATLELLSGYPIVGGPEDRELTTPTGALLVGQLGAQVGAFPAMRPQRVGYGGGTMELERGANVLRAVIGIPLDGVMGDETVVELTTNLDDSSPEVVAHASGLLLADGALDVWTVPALMKKGRAGVELHALVQQEAETQMVERLFQETGTLGIRRSVNSRHVAERGKLTVSVRGKSVDVKWGKWQGALVSVAAEYDDCARVAAASNVALKGVMRTAEEAARRILSDTEEDE